jgi:plasmid stabilization system protein ParE
MARKVIWAPRAVFLLEEAANHIELDSPSAAARLIEETVAAADSLAELADRGRLVPELRDAVHRELFVGRYRLIYRAGPDHVAIVAFVHGARDFRTWWKRYRERAPN